MKTVRLLLLALLIIPATGATSCDQKLEEAQGIHTIKDPVNPGHYVVIEDPDGGKVGKVLTTASGATSGIPIIGQAIGLLTLLGTLTHSVLVSRAKARVDAQNAEYDRTHVASKAGLQSFVDSQPHAVGAALIDELDHAHDAANVPAEHQDAIQPLPRTPA
jgi:hypothetical protein